MSSKRKIADDVENDQPEKKVRESLSKIQSQEDFDRMCEDIGKYHVNTRSVGNFPLPNPLPINNDDLRRIVSAIAPGLSQCARAVHIDSEASRYPFLYEMLKTLVRLIGAANVSARNKLVVDTKDDEDIMSIAEQFERDYIERNPALDNETTIQMLTRWERYFKEKGGYKASEFGYVEFSIEDWNQVCRCRLECKDFLNRHSLPVTANGFWQACGEVVTAQQSNAAQAAKKAGEQAHAATLESYPQQASSKTLSRSAAANRSAAHIRARELAATEAREKAKQQAVEENMKIPLFVILTDVREWIFLKLQGRTITFSEPYMMFNLKGDKLQAMPGLKVGLQYLCYALGISSSHSGVRARLEAAAQCTADDSAALVDSVFPGPTLHEACAFLEGRVGLVSEEANRAAFEKKYPSFDYDRCLASLHEKA